MPGQCDNSEFDCYNLSHCPGIMHNDRINHNARNINTVLPVEANLDDFTMTETPDRADFKTEHFRSLHFFIILLFCVF